MGYSGRSVILLAPSIDELMVLEEAFGLSFGADPDVPTWGWSGIYAPEAVVTVGPHEALGAWPVRLMVLWNDAQTGEALSAFVRLLLDELGVAWTEPRRV
jgi:hypothetical protein